jgi:hypothetical protein
MRSTAIVLMCAAALGGAAWSRPAAASPTYPNLVQQHLSLGYAPPCSVCHQNGVTGYGTVTTPFGKSMRDAGLQAEDPAALNAALDQLAANGTDSDGDGVPDIQELVAGSDPNGPGSLSASRVPNPAYGCGATMAPTRPSRGAGVAFSGLLLAVLAAVPLRRRTSRSPTRSAAGRRRTMAGIWLVGLAAALGLMACYDVSYVSPDVCSSGLMWTGGSGSPDMNPGSSCLSCHAQHGGATFAFAGTVFTSGTEADHCFGTPDATIIIAGSDGRTIEMASNEAGNFYSKLPVGLPFTAAVVAGGKQSLMTTPQTSGDCNGCHRPQGANGAPGRVVVP